MLFATKQGFQKKLVSEKPKNYDPSCQKANKHYCIFKLLPEPDPNEHNHHQHESFDLLYDSIYLKEER